MKRRIQIGLALLLLTAMAIPVFAQGGENNAWLAIQDERDARRRAELLESFIRTYQSSSHRPDVDFMLVDYYVQNRDNAKIMQHAESFRLTLPSADNAAKARVYTQAMVAAATLNNIDKTKEYGKYALDADPSNLTVLVFMGGNGLPDPKTAFGYVEKALTLPKPLTMQQAQYDSMMARMHGLAGSQLFAEQKYQEATPHFLEALKANPKDHAIQFQYGFASVNMAGMSAQSAQAANEELIKVMSATPSNPDEVAAARSKVDNLSKQALEYRDTALEAFAKAVAIGGQFSAQAKQLLDNVYQNKNGSLEGEDQLIAAKKTELGIALP